MKKTTRWDFNMNKTREQIINQFIVDNHLPNAKLISYKDKDKFDYYTFDNIPFTYQLPDSSVLNENGELEFGFLKGVNYEEMRLISGEIRSGKSLRVCTTDLAFCASPHNRHSVIVTDQCGELFTYTSELFLKQGYKVKVLNFANPEHSDTYNPLYREAKNCLERGYISQETEELFTTIAETLITSRSERDPSWCTGAQGYIRGIPYNMCEAVIDKRMEPEEVTPFNLIKQYFYLERQITSAGANNVKLKSLEFYDKLDPLNYAFEAFGAQAEAGGLTRSGYFSVVSGDLSKINYDFTYKITSTSSIDITDLWKEPTILYVITNGQPIGDIISALLIKELISEVNKFTVNKVDKALPIPIYVFLDEFAHINFGTKDQIKTMIETMGKHHIFFNLFVQNDSQLYEKYGEHGTSTLKACLTKTFIGSQDPLTMSNYSELLGEHTFESMESVYNNSAPKLMTGPLVSKDKLLEMGPGEMYTIRKGKDIARLHTYFEGAYNVPSLFKKSNDYLKHIKASQYDYQSHIVLQPLMIKTTSPEEVLKMTKKDLIDHIDRDYDLYEQLLCNKKMELDLISKKKFLKKGLITIKNKKVIPTIDKEYLENAKRSTLRSRRYIPADWDY